MFYYTLLKISQRFVNKMPLVNQKMERISKSFANLYENPNFIGCKSN
jgi:hypothetical protein